MKEGADLFQVDAVANVLEVRTVLDFSEILAFSLADDSRAAILGKLVSRFGKEWADSIRLQRTSSVIELKEIKTTILMKPIIRDERLVCYGFINIPCQRKDIH